MRLVVHLNIRSVSDGPPQLLSRARNAAEYAMVSA
jgi:hypothetical protein